MFKLFAMLWFFSSIPAPARPRARPGPGWGPVRVGALSGLGPCPGWGPARVGAHMGPYGPLWALWALWAHMGPILVKKLIILIKNHEIINKNIKIVNLEILKVKTWFGDKDLFS